VELNFNDEGSGRPVVILHGLFGSSSNWKGIARQLSAVCRVITVDLRNHGGSPWDDDVSYAAMADDVRELLDRLRLERAVLVGHSMGGKVAMTLALTAPERVGALGVVDIAPVVYGHSHEGLIEAMSNVDLTRIGNRRDLDAQLAPYIPEAAVRQFLGQNLVYRNDQYAWRVNLRALARGMTLLTGFPDPGPARYNGDCVFIYGEASDYVLPAHHESIRRHFPRARLVAVPDAGHWVHAERPDRVRAAITELLDDSRGAR
jgi:esterase